jgi:hypothetical protein
VQPEPRLVETNRRFVRTYHGLILLKAYLRCAYFAKISWAGDEVYDCYLSALDLRAQAEDHSALGPDTPTHFRA